MTNANKTPLDLPRTGMRGLAPTGLPALALRSAAAHATARTQDVWEDFKGYATAPVRWDEGNWTQFGVMVAATAVAYQYDDDVRSHFAVHSQAAKPGEDPGELRDIVPAAVIVAGTWAGAA